MPQGAGVVPKIYTENEQQVRDLNTKYINLKKIYDAETIPEHREELMVQLQDLLDQKWKLLPKRKTELAAAGYRKSQVIPLPAGR